MTLKNCCSDLKLLLGNLRRSLWFVTLSGIVMFFAMPVALMLRIQVVMQRVEEGNTTLALAGMNLGQEFFTLNNKAVTIIFIIAAIVASQTAFYYLHSRKQVDFYHSLPIRRERLFTVSFFSGACSFLLPYLIMLIISLIIFSASGLMQYISVWIVLKGLLFNAMYFILVYCVGVISAMLTGNLIVQLLGTGTLLSIGPVMVGMWVTYVQKAYATFYGGFYSFDKWAIYLSPVTAYFTANAAGNDMGSLSGALIGTLAAGLLFASALLLYRGRPSEAAGHAISFKTARPIIKYPIVLNIALLSGLFFSSVSSDEGAGWMIFGFICGGVLSHFMMEVIYSFDFKAIFKNLKGLGIFSLLFAVVGAGMALDVTGYNSYIPARDSVVGVSLDMTSFVDGYMTGSMLDYDQNGRNMDSQRLEKTVMRDSGVIDTALALAKKGVESEKSDYVDLNGNRGLGIVYTLESGRRVARYYRSVPYEACLEDIKTIFDTREYKSANYPIFRMMDFSRCGSYINAFYPSKSGKVHKITDPQKQQKLAQAYRQDIQTLTFDDLKSMLPIAYYAGYNLDDEEDADDILNYGSYWGHTYFYCPIYPTFENTLRAAEALGIEISTGYEPGLVRSVTVMCDEETKIRAESASGYIESKSSSSTTYDQPDKIKQILENAVPVKAAEFNPLFEVESPNIAVDFSYDLQYDRQFNSLYFIKGRIPEFVNEDIVASNK